MIAGGWLCGRVAGVDYWGLCAGGGCVPTGGVRYMWAQLRARIFGVFALQCSRRVRLVGFITEPAPIRQTLEQGSE